MYRFLLLTLAATALNAQTLDNTSLTGDYHFVYLGADVQGGVAESAVNAGGTITFDGAGGYTVQAQVGVGPAAPIPAAAGGTYTVSPNGFATFTNPLNPALRVNARIGAGADAILGASTEADSSYDVIVALRAPSDATTASLTGDYTGAYFALPNGLDAAAATALVSFSADSAGGFTSMTLDGHSVDQNEEPLEETVTGSTYQINADGTGTLTLGAGSSIFSGGKALFVSAGGEYAIGVSTQAGGRDIFLAVRNAQEATNATLGGSYWIVDFFTDRNAANYTSAVGGMRSDGAGGASIAQRMHFLGQLDFSAINSYGLSPDGTGFLRGSADPGVTNLAVSGQGGFVAAEVFQTLSFYESHGVTFGIRAPELSGDDPFVAPLGVLNAASFAPATFPAAPGTLMTAFGSGLADAPAGATAVPWPTQLGGVSIDFGGSPAPVFYVDANQANMQVPFAASGDAATLTLDDNGTAAAPVEIPVAPTSPGVFSIQQSGVGPGAILDVGNQIVNEQNPAAPGDVVVIFMTGLGAVSPAVADGAAAPGAEPFARVIDNELQILFAGEAGSILFAGAAPGFVGLYQVNVRIPATTFTGPAVPVQVLTGNAYSDFVDIAIGL